VGEHVGSHGEPVPLFARPSAGALQAPRGPELRADAVLVGRNPLGEFVALDQGEEYTDQGQAYYEERYRQRVLHNLNRRAQQLGMTLVPTTPAAQAV